MIYTKIIVHGQILNEHSAEAYFMTSMRKTAVIAQSRHHFSDVISSKRQILYSVNNFYRHQ